MLPLDVSLLLNPGHWFDGNPGSASSWYWIPALVFLVSIAAGFYSYYYLRERRFAAHPLHARMADVAGIAAIAYGFWGLFLLLMRFLGVGLLSARLLLYLTLLAGLGMIGYAIYWYSKEYPARLRTHLREEERKRFLPTPKAGRPKPKQATGNAAGKKPAAGRPGGKPAAQTGKNRPAPTVTVKQQPAVPGGPAAGKK
jgi:hypothetical protein